MNPNITHALRANAIDPNSIADKVSENVVSDLQVEHRNLYIALGAFLFFATAFLKLAYRNLTKIRKAVSDTVSLLHNASQQSRVSQGAILRLEQKYQHLQDALDETIEDLSSPSQILVEATSDLVDGKRLLVQNMKEDGSQPPELMLEETNSNSLIKNSENIHRA